MRRGNYPEIPDGSFSLVWRDGYEVARLWQHVQTKQWHARLLLPGGRDRNLPCRSFESGKAGCETWACRHEARLRAEVAAHIEQRRR